MKLNTSYVISFTLFVVIGMWFAFNNAGEQPAAIGKTQAEIQSEKLTVIPEVQVREVIASTHPDMLILYGQSEASREVTLKAETAGIVVAAPVAEGMIAKTGVTVCRQDVDARQSVLDQASANMKSIQNDLNNARILAEKGYQSQTRVTQFEAQLDGAKASVKQAEIELDNVNMRAPFAGVWDRQMAEIGDYLLPGQACGLLVDLSPLNVIAQLTETQVGKVKAGSAATIELATGERVTGKVRFIESKADTMTRTFRTEITVPNADFKLRAGVTATVKLVAGEQRAQQIPANILTLDDAGEVGVRYVDRGDIVRFARVKTIDEDRAGVWVTGLPTETRIIIEGQDYVAIGSKVKPLANYQYTATQ